MSKIMFNICIRGVELPSDFLSSDVYERINFTDVQTKKIIKEKQDSMVNVKNLEINIKTDNIEKYCNNLKRKLRINIEKDTHVTFSCVPYDVVFDKTKPPKVILKMVNIIMDGKAVIR